MNVIRKTPLLLCLTALLSLSARADGCDERVGDLSAAACAVLAEMHVGTVTAEPSPQALSAAPDNAATAALRRLLQEEVLAHSFRLIGMLNEALDGFDMQWLGEPVLLSADDRYFLHWPEAHWQRAGEQHGIRVDLSGMRAEVIAEDAHVDLFFHLPPEVLITDSSGSVEDLRLHTERFLFSARFDRELKAYMAYDLLLESLELRGPQEKVWLQGERLGGPWVTALHEAGWVSQGRLSFAHMRRTRPEAPGDDAQAGLDSGLLSLDISGEQASALREVIRAYPDTLEGLRCLLPGVNRMRQDEAAGGLSDCEAEVTSLVQVFLRLMRDTQSRLATELSYEAQPGEGLGRYRLSAEIGTDWVHQQDGSDRVDSAVAATLSDWDLIRPAQENDMRLAIGQAGIAADIQSHYAAGLLPKIGEFYDSMLEKAEKYAEPRFSGREVRTILNLVDALKHYNFRLHAEDIRMRTPQVESVDIDHVEYGWTYRNTQGRLALSVQQALAFGEQSTFLADVLPPELIPQSLKFGLALNHLPFGAIREEMDSWLDARAQQDKADETISDADWQALEKVLAARLPKMLAQAGIELEILPSSLVLTEPRADLQGRVTFNPDAAYQAEGDMELAVQALDQLIRVVQAMNPRAAAGLSLFQLWSEREEVDGATVDRYALSLTPDGKLMLNGRDITPMLGAR